MTRNINRGPIPSDLGWLVDVLDDVEERLRTIEAPDGSQFTQTVTTLQALVNDIQAQLDAWAAGRRSDAATDAVIDAKIAAAIAAMLGGNVAIGGDLSVAGAVTLPNVFATNIVGLGGTRKAVWVRDGGRMGNTA